MCTADENYAHSLETKLADTKDELIRVLRDWNDLVAAIGSPTNGGAIGYAKHLRAEVAHLRESLTAAQSENTRLVELYRKFESANASLTAQVHDYENREGACCPEDVGFEELIASLTKESDKLKALLRECKTELLNLSLHGANTQAGRLLERIAEALR